MWVALETPIDTLSDHSLDSVHMLQHVLLGFVAPPLLLLGLSGQMAQRMARLRWLRLWLEPAPAQLIAAAVMIAWHLPLLYEAALISEPAHVAEHVCFIGAGCLLYWPLLAATSKTADWQLGEAAKLVYLLLATLPQDGVALAFIFSRSAFYDFYLHAARVVPSLDAVTDQTMAGAILMVVGKATFAVAALAIFFRWFGADRPVERLSP